MDSDARRYRNGGTSWRGYLAATGKRDRSGGDDGCGITLRQVDTTSVNSRRSAARQECLLLTAPEVYDAFGNLLTDIGLTTTEQQAAGYEALRTALRDAIGGPDLDADTMAQVWHDGAKGTVLA
jgi:hypothetical protein